MSTTPLIETRDLCKYFKGAEKMLERLKKEIDINRKPATDFWLSDKSCNKLIEEAENVRLADGGILQLDFENGDILGIKIGGPLFYDNRKLAYAKVEYLNKEYQADVSARNCRIL